MLLELAIGDAYGAGFEYADKKFIQEKNTLQGYVQHPRHKDIQPGRYTDDTQMSIAIAELLIEKKEWTPKNIAEKFVDVFKRDTRTGYSGKFYTFLQSIEDGTEFLKRIKPDSEKSGGAMRSAPIGILQDISQVKEYARIQASITHNTTIGINAGIASALMSHYFMYDLGQKKDLGRFIEMHVSGTWASYWKGEVKSKGFMPVRAAITAVMQYHSLAEILKQCIAFTGDVDTVATIALAAASKSKEVKQDLPNILFTTLENGIYGKEYLLGLDKKLFAIK